MEEIARFLHQHPPFNLLTYDEVLAIAAKMQIEYFATNTDILTHNGDPSHFLYVIRRGSVDLLRENAQGLRVFDTLSEGEVFGYPSLINRQPPIVTIRTREEVLAYLLPTEAFHRLYEDHSTVNQFFTFSTVERLDNALQLHQPQDEFTSELFRLTLKDLHTDVVTVPPDMAIRDVARVMQRHDATSVVVTGAPLGLLSDRDLRNRVLAAGLPDTTPVEQVMTSPIITLPIESLAFESLMLMVEKRIHHIPVTRDGELVGMVTHTDLLRQQSRSPLLLPRLLERAYATDELAYYAQQVEDTAVGMLKAGARVRDIGRMVAVSHDDLLRRILHGAEDTLGAPPCPYAWLVMGSEGRYEQTLRTDQDNALVYADNAPPEAAEYFTRLADHVVQQLVACGFPECPGDIMATNKLWRQPLRVWQSYFETWIARPDEESLLRSTIFFDYRPVYGELDVEAALRPIIEKGRGQRIFLARLARNAVKNRPPLGFFRNFVLERDGEHKDLIDLKHRAIALVVDLARVYGIEAGSAETNTAARLRAAVAHGNLSSVGGEQLLAAFDLISMFRLRHQARQLQAGLPPNNLVPVSELSPPEQQDLKEALRAIGDGQKGAEHTFQTGSLG